MPRKNPVQPEIQVTEANNRPEQQMNNTQNTDWSSMPPNAIWLLAVTIFMSFVGFQLGGLRERINRKRKAVDQFRSIIARQLADLDTHRWSEAVFYTQSVPIITDATYAFRPFISHRCRRALDHILADYQARHESEFAPGLPRAIAAMKKDGLKVNGEFYVAPSYTYLLKQGGKISTFNVGDVETDVHGLGTPEDLKLFLLNSNIDAFQAMVRRNLGNRL